MNIPLKKAVEKGLQDSLKIHEQITKDIIPGTTFRILHAIFTSKELKQQSEQDEYNKLIVDTITYYTTERFKKLTKQINRLKISKSKEPFIKELTKLKIKIKNQKEVISNQADKLSQQKGEIIQKDKEIIDLKYELNKLKGLTVKLCN